MNSAKFLGAALFVLLLSGCEGGGDSSPAVPALTTSVAMAGELLDYTLDTTNLTYSYTITESQFGLAGKTGSGTLVRHADGSRMKAGLELRCATARRARVMCDGQTIRLWNFVGVPACNFRARCGLNRLDIRAHGPSYTHGPS